MKKFTKIAAICLAGILMTGCYLSEPIVTVYGDSVHEAVGGFYEDYEILALVTVESDNKPTPDKLCVIDDKNGGIDIMNLSYDKVDGEYITIQSIIAENIQFGAVYSTDAFGGIIVEYVICERQNIPDSFLQKKKFKHDGSSLYFCITNISV